MNFSATTPASEVFAQVEAYILSHGYTIIDKDHSRPWGGFFVLDESQAAKFAAQFFPQLSLDAIQITQKLSPKFLVVAPEKRLSWQYHHRRAEIWRVIQGQAGVVTSHTDEEGALQVLKFGDTNT